MSKYTGVGPHICIEDLIMKKGHRAFTKGKIYMFKDNYTKNDQGRDHTIGNPNIEDECTVKFLPIPVVDREEAAEMIRTCNEQANMCARKYAQTDEEFYKQEYNKYTYCADMLQALLQRSEGYE